MQALRDPKARPLRGTVLVKLGDEVFELTLKAPVALTREQVTRVQRMEIAVVEVPADG